MWTEQQAREAIGKTVYSTEGEKIGKVGQVFLDDQSGRPEFVTVNTGFFGSSESFVPVMEATVTGDDLSVPFGKDKVKEAPRVDIDGGHLDEADEQRLFEYYGLTAGSTNGGTDHTTDTHASVAGTEGHDTSGPTTDNAMTRSEEHLDVAKTTESAGRARLRKYVTTENESVTVPVRKERAVLETEPITEANVGNATDGPEISEEEHEVVLNEERVVVDKVAEPVERVRLGTESVTTEETVSDDVRKEHIEVDGDVDRR